MKKTFLSIAVVGAMFAANGYAEGQQSILVSYICPDTCTIKKDAESTKFSCIYSDAKECGTPTAKILELTSVPEKTTEKVDQTANEKTKPAIARAARKQNIKPNNIKPTGTKPDKAMGGDVFITCPEGCTIKCLEDFGTCACVDKRGNICNESTTITGPVNID